MVLEQGRIKEFDSPRNLLSDKKTIFYAMMKDANLLPMYEEFADFRMALW